MKYYILDANVIILIWNKYPQLLGEIENNEIVDFKISNDIANELSQKEYHKFKGMPILSEKFLKLINHIIYNNEIDNGVYDILNIDIKYNSHSKMYSINNNKISLNDFNLIILCKNNKEYFLVTEDKKMYNCAKLILEEGHVFTFQEFISDVNIYI